MCQAACEEHFADAAVGMANKIDASFCSSRILAMLLREFVLIMLQIALGKHSPQTLSAAASRPVAVTVLHYCISMMQYGVHNVDLSKNSERVILSNLGSIYQSDIGISAIPKDARRIAPYIDPLRCCLLHLASTWPDQQRHLSDRGEAYLPIFPLPQIAHIQNDRNKLQEPPKLPCGRSLFTVRMLYFMYFYALYDTSKCRAGRILTYVMY